MKCLLCGSEKLVVSESYPIQDLKELWYGIGINVESELSLPIVEAYSCSNCSLIFFDPALAGGDKFYSALGQFDWYYSHPGKTEYDYVQKYIQDGNSILDIGSGRGVLYTKIQQKVEYVGLELSTKAVEMAQQMSINVIQQDLSIHAQSNPSKYDIVCLFQVLEHLTELDTFIKSVYLTLKKGGLFVIAVPNNDGFVFYSANYTFNLPPHHTNLWTEKSLRFLAEKYKFEVVEVHKELLQDVHRDHAYKVYMASIIKKCLFLPNKLLDKSQSHSRVTRLVNRLYHNANMKKIIMPFLEKRQKYGQSIIVTLRKN